jgi:hypothetical protein
MKRLLVLILAFAAVAFVPGVATADDYDEYGNLISFPGFVWNSIDDDTSNDPTPDEIWDEWYGQPTDEDETDDPFGGILPSPGETPWIIPHPPVSHEFSPYTEYINCWEPEHADQEYCY